MIYYNHIQELDGQRVHVNMAFHGDLLPNAYKWPGPMRRLDGKITVDDEVVYERTISTETPKRSHAEGNVSETFGAALWSWWGADFWRAVRRDLKSQPERLRALLEELDIELERS